MFEFFQRYYSFRAVIYTNSKLVRSFALPLGIYCEGNYEVNVYGMPLASSMFDRAKKLARADYYGFINSDIILSPNIFGILKQCMNLVENGKISPKVGIENFDLDFDFDCQ